MTARYPVGGNGPGGGPGDGLRGELGFVAAFVGFWGVVIGGVMCALPPVRIVGIPLLVLAVALFAVGVALGLTPHARPVGLLVLALGALLIALGGAAFVVSRTAEYTWEYGEDVLVTLPDSYSYMTRGARQSDPSFDGATWTVDGTRRTGTLDADWDDVRLGVRRADAPPERVRARALGGRAFTAGKVDEEFGPAVPLGRAPGSGCS
ncbi:hypothetical protein BJF79_05410 [Actinomadura sp. CNU-125]|uniref:hypothetical protein n=1 Tax=Actinomadura sp. CNU-125 TaxID=1904961 RepID=UPI000969F189|nr:hypothetical protein [Actinomadura sp. CNU-125]OLT38172.1 hypothetical protein BJF79_05410 [Actinomadura sp. CNU-125]